MKANIGITAAHTKKIALLLNTLLADETILYTKTRNYHWNIESTSFIEMHEFYESQYTVLAGLIDEVAERIRQIGHFAEGRLKDYIKLANLDEPEYTDDQQTQIKNLLEDHDTLCRTIRTAIPKVEEEYKDVGTADFLTGVLKEHEKMGWMLRAYLK